jgi:translation elongation factor EF-Ts
VKELASQLALHVAAMKPNYYTITDVPQTVIDKTLNELNDLATP